MILYGRPYTNENGWEDKGLLSDKDPAVQETVLSWIKEHIRERRTVYRSRTSYGLKHDLQRDTNIYLTNNEFKDAMMQCGYLPVNPDELNWYYRIRFIKDPDKEPEPFYRWVAGTIEKDDSPEGDFARDVKEDETFPHANSRKTIAGYLAYRGACREAVAVFGSLWKQYAKYRKEKSSL